MRTAIYVYQPTLLRISTIEDDLRLCSMNAESIALSNGNNEQLVGPGVYKICSCECVEIAGDGSSFDLVTTAGKDSDPVPPLRASTSFEPLDTAALRTFMIAAEEKHLINP